MTITNRILLMLCFIFSIAFSAYTQSKLPKNPQKQIKWVNTIDEALKLSKNTGKPIFVECYLPTCPVCMTFEPLFNNPEIAQFYNSNFINFKLNGENAQHVKFLNNRSFRLPSFPQFLFFDFNGNLIHSAESNAETQSFLNIGKVAADPKTRASNYKLRFGNGEKNLDFLIHYSIYTRLLNDHKTNEVLANEIFNQFPKDEINSESSWLITKKCVGHIENGFTKHWMENIEIAAAFEKKAGHPENEKNILGQIVQTALISDEIKSYSIEKIDMLKGYFSKVASADIVDRFTWEMELRALAKANKELQMLALGEKIVAQFKTNAPSILYILKVYNDVFPSKSYETNARLWFQMAKALIKEDKDKYTYHYENARFHLKLEDQKTALMEANSAKSIAVKSKLNLNEINSLLNIISPK